MIAISFNGMQMSGDLSIGSTGLVQDDSLTTCVLVSLFTDRRARPDDPLPAGNGDYRRGWVGDALADRSDDRIGSRLWLLRREKQTEETRRRAEEYCREALAWLVSDGLASRIDVSAEWVRQGLLGVVIVIDRVDGERERHAIDVTTGAV